MEDRGELENLSSGSLKYVIFGALRSHLNSTIAQLGGYNRGAPKRIFAGYVATARQIAAVARTELVLPTINQPQWRPTLNLPVESNRQASQTCTLSLSVTIRVRGQDLFVETLNGLYAFSHPRKQR